jgi:hypothetical protein
MLDRDLAFLYEVRTKHLNQQVKRNPTRFPADFMFRLSAEEAEAIRGRGSRGSWHGKLPYAFTEQGAGMLAAVLRGETAAKVTIHILRVFASLRTREEPVALSDVERDQRTMFHAVRDAFLLHHEDKPFTTDVSYTYFIQAGADGPIKIGSTRNLVVRLRTLATIVPVPLRLLGVMRGNHENHCHARLAAFRSHGEWFMSCETVHEFIRKYAITPRTTTKIAERLPKQGTS